MLPVPTAQFRTQVESVALAGLYPNGQLIFLINKMTSRSGLLNVVTGIQTSCNPGDETDFAGILCYPKCMAGYSPVSMLCWSTCNQVVDNTQDQTHGVRLRSSGDDWRDDGAVCGKRLYDRGIGTIPDACSDSNRQIFVGMCYTKCNGGFSATTWSPLTCSQSCPNNTTEGGFANCTKQNSYGRGGGNWGNGCPGGYTNMGLWCTNWSNFRSSGYSCPGGDYDPMTNSGGQCRYAPRGGRGSYGINTCYGKSIALGATLAFDGTVNPMYPNGNIKLTDSNGNEYSAYGCYPDTNNPASWLAPRPSDDPQYYKSAYYPKWHSASGCSSDPGSTAVRYPSSATCVNLPNDPTAGVPSIQVSFPGGLYSNTRIPVPLDADGNSLGDFYNTVRAPQQSNSCEENWGTLCYPKCDVGYYGFGCCVCSPSCSPLRDDGATCHRDWYDRGVGKIPDACRDDNKIYEELLCYTKCKQDFAPFCTTCTRRGCPYGGKGETPLCCFKDVYYRGPGTIAIPALAGKVNSKINIGALADGLQRIILNVVVILLCLLAALFIFSTNVFLRTKHIKLKN